MRGKYLAWLTLVIGIVIGAVVSKWIHCYNRFEFEWHISLGELVNALAALAAAAIITVFITYFFERHNQADRKEKDLLLRRLDMIYDLAEKFELAISGQLLADVVSTQKKLSMSCAAFQKLLGDFKYSPKILAETEFEELIREIRKLVTDTPIREIEKLAKSKACKVTVKDGLIKMASEQRALIDGKVNELKLRINRAQFVLNRHG